MKRFFKRHEAKSSAPTEPLKEQYGLFELHSPPTVDIDIVAVHGLGGHFEKTWTDNISQKLWLRDFLPTQLQDVAIAARVMSYGYDSTTAFSKSVTDVEDQATMLVNALSLDRSQPSEKNRPLVFIAHSLGGVIVKKALIIAHERSSHYGQLLNSAKALVFFSVPHRGSDLAYWSTFAAKLLKTVQLGLGTNESFVEALQRNSQTFADISQSFIERGAPLTIRTFYETEKLYGNLIVDKDSARLGLVNEIAVGVAAADHRTICKFNDKDSIRYKPVWQTIRALCVKSEEATALTVPKEQSESFFVVPFSRDLQFLGREDVIDLVNTKFESEQRVALTGIGGVGKSQIAIEYCYRFREQHPDSNIFWVHASTKERFEQAFKAIARQCRLPGWDDPATNPLDLVYDWLNGDNTWLMILDNADDKDVFFNQHTTHMSQNSDSKPSTVPLATYLPQIARGGSILITSRNRDAAFRLTNSAASLIDVPFMNKDNAVTLLCKKLSDDHSSDDERLELVGLLECLPLAITQAAAYISVKRTRMTIARYSDFLRKNERILLHDMGDLRRDPSIPSSVLMTWQISFDQIHRENGPAVELLSLMSVFDRQGIPKFLLQGENEDDLQFEGRLAPLEEFSLITFEGDGRSFQIHRLVQIAIRSWLEQHREIDRWKQYAAVLVDEASPNADYQSWKTWEILLPHSEVVLDYVAQDPNCQQLYANILEHTARYFKERGERYDAARERCQRALEIRITLFGEDDVVVARSLLVLADINRRDRVAEFDEIEAMNRRALAIFERVLGKDSDWSKVAQNNLAVTLLRTDDVKKIEEVTEIFRSILESQEQNIGPDDPRTLVTKNNLALSLYNQCNYKDAETLFRQTLSTSLRVLGEENPRTIYTMHNLAECLTKQASYEEAEEFAQRALNLRKLMLGEEHPDTLLTMRILTHIFEKQHRYAEAEESRRHSLGIRTRIWGPDHSETIKDMAELAKILHDQGKHAQAEVFFQEVYSRRPVPWSDRDWDRFLADFAETLASLRKFDEAEGIFRQLLDTHTTRLEPDDLETITDMANLAGILYDQSKHAQAEAFFQEVYSSGRPEPWSDSGWDRFLAEFADTLAELGKHDEAADISRQRVYSEESDPNNSEMSAE